MRKNRPQVGSGPTYSDSPSDNANSSITSSPTDTLRTSKNSDAKIVKNLTPIKANIKKFKNNDYYIDYSNGWNGALIGLRKLLQLNYRGGSNYSKYRIAMPKQCYDAACAGNLHPLLRGEEEREDDTGSQNADNYQHRCQRADMDTHQRQQHLHTDKAQQYRQTDFQVSEFVHHAFQHEEEGTQAQNGKDIGKENNIWILGNREYCRDGVKGKDDIRELDNQQHHKQRGEQPASIHFVEKVVAIEL